jgi:hypothetical protein
MKLDPIRALRIIEGMVIEVSDEKPFSNIYMVAHQASKPDCAKNHPSFAEKALELEAELVKDGLIEAWTEDE